MNISEMAWGVTLWFDLWAVGIASSAFIAAFIINKMSGGRRENLFKLAVYTGIVFAMTGVILLLSHLGHIEWFWHMFVTVRPSSVLNMGGWILSGWLTVASVMAVLWIAGGIFKGLASFARSVNGFLSWIGFALSFLLVTYGGVLIATTSQPLWASTLMVPALFVGSAVASGLAWLILASLIANWATGTSALRGLMKGLFGSADWEIERAVTIGLARALYITLILEFIILVGFAIWLAAAAPTAFSETISGGLVYFWIGLIILGIALPFFLLLYYCSGRCVTNTRAAAIASIAAFLPLVSSLVVRAVILISGQM
jgi:formate-dependent nitrite reductase membrane component NrfD